MDISPLLSHRPFSSPFHSIHQTPLPIAPHNILLDPTNRPPRHSPQHTKPRRHNLKPKHKKTHNPEYGKEFHEFIHLVEIVLGLYEVDRRILVFLFLQLEDGSEGDGGPEEGDEEDVEDLVDGDVED